MKTSKKNVIIMLLTILSACSLLFVGCGSKSEDGSGVIEETSDMGTQIIEVEETEEEATAELTSEAVKEEPALPVWYMDEDGLKNVEMNLVVRKNNELKSDCQIDTTLLIDGQELAFYCSYSDENMDEYISSRPEMQKGQIENIEYAYNEQDIIFIGNGIKVRATYIFWGAGEITDVGKWLEEKQIIKTLTEPSLDCLAYNTKDGLYCPALGIAICNKEEVSSVGGTYYYEYNNDYAYITCVNQREDEIIEDAQNVDDAIANFKDFFSTSSELIWCDNDIEVNIGDLSLKGTGFDRGDGFISFMFPDNLEYYLDIYSSNEQACKDALAVIENMN